MYGWKFSICTYWQLKVLWLPTLLYATIRKFMHQGGWLHVLIFAPGLHKSFFMQMIFIFITGLELKRTFLHKLLKSIWIIINHCKAVYGKMWQDNENMTFNSTCHIFTCDIYMLQWFWYALPNCAKFSSTFRKPVKPSGNLIWNIAQTHDVSHAHVMFNIQESYVPLLANFYFMLLTNQFFKLLHNNILIHAWHNGDEDDDEVSIVQNSLSLAVYLFTFLVAESGKMLAARTNTHQAYT